MMICPRYVKSRRAQITCDEVIKFVEKEYGLFVTNIEELNGYDDRNFKLTTKLEIINNNNIKEIWPFGYVLKVINTEDSKNIELIEAQNYLMEHLNEHKFKVPVPVINKEGYSHTVVYLEEYPGNIYRAKLLTYQPGLLLNDNKPNKELYTNVGKYLAEINIAMESFKNEYYSNYKTLWDLENTSEIRKYFHLLKDKDKLTLIEKNVDNFEKNVLPNLTKLEVGMIHGDFNEHNLLTEGNKVRALIDFGDAHMGPYLFEIAICICYTLVHSKDMKYGGDIVNGYSKRRQLTDEEKKLLKTCVCARLCQTLLLGLHFYELYEDDYILSSQPTGWSVLQQLTDYNDDKLKELWNLV